MVYLSKWNCWEWRCHLTSSSDFLQNIIEYGFLFPRFGWFGIVAQEVSRPILNYCGAGLCLLRLATFWSSLLFDIRTKEKKCKGEKKVNLFWTKDMLFLFCPFCSGLIFFFVKSDVELHPNPESIPLLIDRVSTLIGCWSVSFLNLTLKANLNSPMFIQGECEGQSIPATWYLKVSCDDFVLFRVFCWCHCFEKQHDSILGCCSFLQRITSSNYGPSSSEFWIDVIGPKTRRLMWANSLTVSELCAQILYLQAKNIGKIYETLILIKLSVEVFLEGKTHFKYFNEALGFSPKVLVIHSAAAGYLGLECNTIYVLASVASFFSGDIHDMCRIGVDADCNTLSLP